jgi:hypothetical protein
MLRPTIPAAATRPLGPAIVGAPGAVAWGPNRLDISVGGTDTPSAVSWDENRIDVLALGTNGQLMHKHYSM